MNKMDEIILVAPRAKVFNEEKLAFQGSINDEKHVEEIVKNINESFQSMRRGDAEENEAYLQPIPYAVIRRGSELYLYERLTGGGEKRLHGKLSLGAGGHMNAIDGINNFQGMISVNLDRELEEELDISDNEARITTFGLINDDSDAVSRVHIGILCVVDIQPDADVSVRETEQLQGQWTTLDHLKNQDVYNRLESWSKIVVDSLS